MKNLEFQHGKIKQATAFPTPTKYPTMPVINDPTKIQPNTRVLYKVPLTVKCSDDDQYRIAVLTKLYQDRYVANYMFTALVVYKESFVV